MISTDMHGVREPEHLQNMQTPYRKPLDLTRIQSGNLLDVRWTLRETKDDREDKQKKSHTVNKQNTFHSLNPSPHDRLSHKTTLN